jgi:hypothetical protein
MSKLALIVATAGTIGLLTLGTGREASAQTLTALHSFSGPDGSAPQAGLIFDATEHCMPQPLRAGLRSGSRQLQLPGII